MVSRRRGCVLYVALAAHSGHRVPVSSVGSAVVGALEAHAVALAAEAASYGVKVFCVIPPERTWGSTDEWTGTILSILDGRLDRLSGRTIHATGNPDSLLAGEQARLDGPSLGSGART